jgi:LmbE family N-acetylglucosaminyl deacetylase
VAIKKPFKTLKPFVFVDVLQKSRDPLQKRTKTVAVIVAHPDDETLWAGGTILSYPSWRCFVVCLSRKNDRDRAPKFAAALKKLGASGIMGDMDDGQEQKPIDENVVQDAILQLLPSMHFDLIITHSVNGEYTRHLRHEEIGNAVIKLWHAGKISADELWAFAYEDGHRSYYPWPIENAPVYYVIPKHLWEFKYDIVTKIYGFDENSWEAQTTPKEEAFWQFFNADDALQWLAKGGYHNENIVIM